MEKIKLPRGAPVKPEAEKLIQRSIRMNAEAWAKVDAYGRDWLRDVVKRAKPPK